MGVIAHTLSLPLTLGTEEKKRKKKTRENEDTRERSEKQGTWAVLSLLVRVPLTHRALYHPQQREQGAKRRRSEGGRGGATKGGSGCGAGVLLLFLRYTHSHVKFTCLHACARTYMYTQAACSRDALWRTLAHVRAGLALGCCCPLSRPGTGSSQTHHSPSTPTHAHRVPPPPTMTCKT
jgi:hypothetical protein